MEDLHLQPFYLHFINKKEAATPEQAAEYAQLYNDIINCLAEKFPVYVRRIPQSVSENDFETGMTTHFTMVRFSIGTEKYAGIKGRIDSRQIYDDEAPLVGFGLLNNG